MCPVYTYHSTYMKVGGQLLDLNAILDQALTQGHVFLSIWSIYPYMAKFGTAIVLFNKLQLGWWASELQNCNREHLICSELPRMYWNWGSGPSHLQETKWFLGKIQACPPGSETTNQIEKGSGVSAIPRQSLVLSKESTETSIMVNICPSAFRAGWGRSILSSRPADITNSRWVWGRKTKSHLRTTANRNNIYL